MDKKVTSIVAYITWVGWVVAYCAGDKEGAKFHLNQALVVALISVLSMVIGWIPFIGRFISPVLWLVWLACVIIGVIYANSGEDKEIPVIGQIKILK